MELNKIEDIKGKLKSKIIGRKKYFNSAILVTLVEIDNELNFILQKRSKKIRQGGEISFPGGKRDESDISFEMTAKRETIEEIGVKEKDLEIFGKIGTLVIPAGVIVEAYIGRITCKVEDLVINKDEVERILVIPVDFFKEKEPVVEKIAIEMNPNYEIDGKEQKFPAEMYNMNKKYHKIWRGLDRNVYIYEYDGEVIWGITAEIIYEVVNNIL